MSEYIRTINEADAAAKLFKQGKMTAVELEERLTELGFYNITSKTKETTMNIMNIVNWAILVSAIAILLSGCAGQIEHSMSNHEHTTYGTGVTQGTEGPSDYPTQPGVRGEI